MCAKEDKLNWDELKLMLDKLVFANDSYDHHSVRDLLIKIALGFKPQSEISDILYKNKN